MIVSRMLQRQCKFKSRRNVVYSQFHDFAMKKPFGSQESTGNKLEHYEESGLPLFDMLSTPALRLPGLQFTVMAV